MIDKEWLKRRDIEHKELNKNFSNPTKHYKPYMFWFWIDNEPNPENYGTQAREMTKKGISAGYAQNRGFERPSRVKGEVNAKSSEKWFECFDAALEETKKAGYTLGYCEPATYLASNEFRESDDELTALSLSSEKVILEKNQSISICDADYAVFAQTENGIIKSSTLKRCEKGEFTATENGVMYLFSFFTASSGEGFETNVLTKKASERAIEILHKPYIERYKEDYGDAINGHFFDLEGSYGYKLCYSKELEEYYNDHTGRDMISELPLLLEKDVEGKWMKVRYDWHDAVSEVYAKCLFGYQSDEVEKYGVFFTSHLWEEHLLGQAMLSGDPMRIYRTITMPGIDHLGRDYWCVRSYKEAQSVCELSNKRFSCELLGCSGWELTPDMMHASINNAVSHSVSHFIMHGAYSRRDDITKAKYATDFYDWVPMWEFFDQASDYMTRASYLISKGTISTDVLLYNPIESIWALLGDTAYNSDMSFENIWVYDYSEKMPEHLEFGKEISEIDKKYTELIDILANNRIGYLISDKYYMDKMELVGDKLCLNGHSFSSIVLPPMDILTLKTADKILQFAKNGGYVYAAGRLPKASADNGADDKEMLEIMNKLSKQKNFIAVDNIEDEIGKGGLIPIIEFAEGGFRVYPQKRVVDGHSFYWIANNTDDVQKCEILFPDEAGRTYMWNPETGERYAVASENTQKGSIISCEFAKSEGVFFEFVKGEEPLPAMSAQELSEIIPDGKWRIYVDDDRQPRATGFDLGVPQELYTGIESELKPWKDFGLESFSGFVEYEKEFELPFDTDKLIIDLGEVRYMTAVSVDDGEQVCRLWSPFVFEFNSPMKKGHHKIHIHAGNTLINLLEPHNMDGGDRKYWPMDNPDEDDYINGVMGTVKIKYTAKGD